MGPAYGLGEGVSYREPLRYIDWKVKFVFSGELRFFSSMLTGKKGVLNKKGRRKDCEEVGSDQSFLADKREPESFSPETRIIVIEDLASRSAKKSPIPDLEMARFKIRVLKGGALFFCP